MSWSLFSAGIYASFGRQHTQYVMLVHPSVVKLMTHFAFLHRRGLQDFLVGVSGWQEPYAQARIAEMSPRFGSTTTGASSRCSGQPQCQTRALFVPPPALWARSNCRWMSVGELIAMTWC